MPSPFVDRMATIEETTDNPTPGNMAEQQGPGYKLVRVAEANSQPRGMLKTVATIVFLCEVFFLRLLRVFHLWQIITYVVLLAWTSTRDGGGTSPKLFAVSQFLDLSKHFPAVDEGGADQMLQSQP